MMRYSPPILELGIECREREVMSTVLSLGASLFMKRARLQIPSIATRSDSVAQMLAQILVAQMQTKVNHLRHIYGQTSAFVAS